MNFWDSCQKCSFIKLPVTSENSSRIVYVSPSIFFEIPNLFDISVLKLSFDSNSNEYFFNYSSIITKRLSCIQYLLIKYGITKNDWDNKNISSNWLGFEHINLLLDSINEKNNNQLDNSNILKSNGIDKCSTQTEPNKVLLCLLYPVIAHKQNLKSVDQFLKLHK